MSIKTRINRHRYVGDGRNRTFAFSFACWEPSQVSVFVGNGVTETDATARCKISLSGDDAGGTATFTTPPAAGQIVVVKRNMPYLQEDTYPNGGRFNANEVERRLDMDCAERQDLLSGVERALKMPETSAEDGTAVMKELLGLKEALDRAGDISGAVPILAEGSTTARSLAVRLGELINVKDYGAIGDGHADDTAAFMAASARQAATGGKLFIPSGTYIIAETVTLPGDVMTAGEVTLSGPETADETRPTSLSVNGTAYAKSSSLYVIAETEGGWTVTASSAGFPVYKSASKMFCRTAGGVWCLVNGTSTGDYAAGAVDAWNDGTGGSHCSGTPNYPCGSRTLASGGELLAIVPAFPQDEEPPAVRLQFRGAADLFGMTFKRLFVYATNHSEGAPSGRFSARHCIFRNALLLLGSALRITRGYTVESCRFIYGGMDVEGQAVFPPEMRDQKAIRIINCNDVSIDGNFFSSFATAVAVEPTRSCAARNIRISRNESLEHKCGIRLSGTSMFRITGCRIEGNTLSSTRRDEGDSAAATYADIFATYCHNLRIRDNAIQEASSNAITFGACFGVDISGNQISNSTEYRGIYFGGCYDVDIYRNVVNVQGDFVRTVGCRTGITGLANSPNNASKGIHVHDNVIYCQTSSMAFKKANTIDIYNNYIKHYKYGRSIFLNDGYDYYATSLTVAGMDEEALSFNRGNTYKIEKTSRGYQVKFHRTYPPCYRCTDTSKGYYVWSDDDEKWYHVASTIGAGPHAASEVTAWEGSQNGGHYPSGTAGGIEIEATLPENPGDACTVSEVRVWGNRFIAPPAKDTYAVRLSVNGERYPQGTLPSGATAHYRLEIQTEGGETVYTVKAGASYPVIYRAEDAALGYYVWCPGESAWYHIHSVRGAGVHDAEEVTKWTGDQNAGLYPSGEADGVVITAVVPGQADSSLLYDPAGIAQTNGNATANLEVLTPPWISSPVHLSAGETQWGTAAHIVQFRIYDYRQIRQIGGTTERHPLAMPFKRSSSGVIETDGQGNPVLFTERPGWLQQVQEDEPLLAWNSAPMFSFYASTPAEWNATLTNATSATLLGNGELFYNGAHAGWPGMEDWWGSMQLLTIDKHRKLTCRRCDNPDDLARYLASGDLGVAAGAAAEGIWQSVAFRPALVVDGRNYASDLLDEATADGNQSEIAFLSTTRSARTALGQKLDGTFVIMCVDGASGSNKGATQVELATKMRAMGCVNAFNMDGGGSSALWLSPGDGTLDESGIINVPAPKTAELLASRGLRSISSIMYLTAGR